MVPARLKAHPDTARFRRTFGAMPERGKYRAAGAERDPICDKKLRVKSLRNLCVDARSPGGFDVEFHAPGSNA